MLSLVIINYNTFQLTTKCIQSVYETTTVPFEIILIDNNSREVPAEQFLEKFPELQLIPLKENLGFGRACNLGMEKAKGKYILLLNSDTIVLPGTIDETVRYLEQHPEVDILGCMSKYVDGTLQLTAYHYYNELNPGAAFVKMVKSNSFLQYLKRKFKLGPVKSTSKPEKNYTPGAIVPNYVYGYRIGSLAGVYLLFKKSVYTETGGFDPDFFMYSEEIEWFIKRLRAYNIVYYDRAAIIHYGGGSDIYNKMSLQQEVSTFLLWYKLGYVHYLLFVLMSLLEVPSLLLVGVLSGNKVYYRNALTLLRALSYAFFDIPRYSNKFGARKEMLKVNYILKNQL